MYLCDRKQGNIGTLSPVQWTTIRHCLQRKTNYTAEIIIHDCGEMLEMSAKIKY